jgi:CBS domain-containing protein
MSVGEYCSREVIVAYGDEPVRTAARLMRQHHVGDVIVVEDRGGRRYPIGIVTDRDLVVEVLEAGVDPEQVVLADLLIKPLLTAREDDGVADTLHRMHERGVRRIPVVDDAGVLIGVLSIDDVLAVIAEEMSDLSGLVARERSRERDTRSGHPAK